VEGIRSDHSEFFESDAFRSSPPDWFRTVKSVKSPRFPNDLAIMRIAEKELAYFAKRVTITPVP
jgi:hypothetical protein